MLSLIRFTESEVYVGNDPDNPVILTTVSVDIEQRLATFQVEGPGFSPQKVTLTPRNTYSLGPGTYMKLLDIIDEDTVKIGISAPKSVKIERDDR